MSLRRAQYVVRQEPSADAAKGERNEAVQGAAATRQACFKFARGILGSAVAPRSSRPRVSSVFGSSLVPRKKAAGRSAWLGRKGSEQAWTRSNWAHDVRSLSALGSALARMLFARTHVTDQRGSPRFRAYLAKRFPRERTRHDAQTPTRLVSVRTLSSSNFSSTLCAEVGGGR